MRENDLLRHVYQYSAGMTGLFDAVAIPPGDDMGGLRFGGSTLLITVDQVADGVHVDLTRNPLDLVGRKCITRNLSDVAAMAALPVAAVVAVTLPRTFLETDATALFDAMKATAEHHHCPLIGGDIGIWDGPLVVTVTVLADPAGIEPVRRAGARPGDGIFVSGLLGDSLASGHHLNFEPRLELARALAGNPATRPTAMIDLSDGLASDLPRLTDHAMVEAALLPIRPGTPEPGWRHAVGDGEDYELLFTAAPDAIIPHELAGVPITRIGRVVDRGGVHLVLPDATEADLPALGWEHHA